MWVEKCVIWSGITGCHLQKAQGYMWCCLLRPFALPGFIPRLLRKGSRVIMGDKGHPCLVPLWIQKASDTWPLALTLAWGEAYRDRILPWNLSQVPKNERSCPWSPMPPFGMPSQHPVKERSPSGPSSLSSNGYLMLSKCYYVPPFQGQTLHDWMRST